MNQSLLDILLYQSIWKMFLQYFFVNFYFIRQGSDSGVDTYFGFCTYPGRELRHRIDIKVTIVTLKYFKVFVLSFF